MKKDYTVECWSCGASNMEKTGDYYTCRNCGTTWTPLPAVGPPIVEARTGGQNAGLCGSPSDALTKQIAKERAAAGAVESPVPGLKERVDALKAELAGLDTIPPPDPSPAPPPEKRREYKR